MSKTVRRLLATIIFVAWVALLGLAALNRQNIWDWWRLRNYTAPAAVAQLATDDTLTPYARKVLYVNKPQLDDKAAFAPLCPSGTEQTVVLGCYHGNQSGIFVLSVSDPRLHGIEQVTTAHEMLHAAYERLDAKTRNQVNGWLNDYAAHDLHDPAILDQIASYKKTEPKDVASELHSLLGSQVAQLTPELETYYSRYFEKRAAVVTFYSSYQAAFTDRQIAIRKDDAQLTAWKQQIDAYRADLQTKNASLSAQQAQLNRLRSTSVSEYNAAVPAYNAAVDAYNDEVGALKALIAQYNQLVAARNAIAVESQELANEISSQVSPIAQ